MAPPFTAARLVAKLAVVVALFVVTLLVPAGTWRWPAVWAFLGLYLTFAVPVGAWLLRTNPALLAQRLDWAKRAPKAWDRALMAGLVPIFVATYVLAGLDFRLGWSAVPLAVRAVAFAWYDFRNSLTDANEALDVYYACTNCGGVSFPNFSHNVRVTDVSHNGNCLMFGAAARQPSTVITTSWMPFGMAPITSSTWPGRITGMSPLATWTPLPARLRTTPAIATRISTPIRCW